MTFGEAIGPEALELAEGALGKLARIGDPGATRVRREIPNPSR